MLRPFRADRAGDAPGSQGVALGWHVAPNQSCPAPTAGPDVPRAMPWAGMLRPFGAEERPLDKQGQQQTVRFC